MVNENLKSIIENKKPTETVYEIKNEIPSFEEFMKDYNENEKVKNSYQGEFESYSDIRVGRSYGPGNNQLFDEEETDKLSRYMSRYLVSKGISVALGPLAPLSISIGEGLKTVSGRSRPFPEKIIALANDPSSLLETTEDSPSNESKEENEFMK